MRMQSVTLSGALGQQRLAALKRVRPTPGEVSRHCPLMPSGNLQGPGQMPLATFVRKSDDHQKKLKTVKIRYKDKATEPQ